MIAPLPRALKPIRVLLAGFAFGLLLWVFSRDLRAYSHSLNRGRLARSIVREVISSLAASYRNDSAKKGSGTLVREDDSLEKWLIAQTTRSDDPAQVRTRIDQMLSASAFSPRTRDALEGWKSALEAWARSATLNAGTAGMGKEDLLREGRLHHFQAAAFERIGRNYDATAYYLWSSSSLIHFIETAPEDDRVPEALFLLGINYVEIRPGMPPGFRSDRILNLCSELYPESIWAKQVDATWQIDQGKVKENGQG